MWQRCLPLATALLALSISVASAQSDGSTVFLPNETGGNSFTPVSGPANHLGSFSIVIAPDATLAGNAPALAAFNRAAQQWAARISDPITVTINASLAALPVNVIGSTSSVILDTSYDSIRNRMVADAADEGTDDAIVAFLPTAAQFNAVGPAGFSLSGNLQASKANLKALGYPMLDTIFGAADGSITFSTAFGFDFDNSNGVGVGLVDFETVAAHEIGHLLGFFSSVDGVDFAVANGQTGAITPATLDLFRFQNNVAGRDPSTTAEFTSFPRLLAPGIDAVTDEIFSPELRMSTGRFTGDGNQASHWKDDGFTGVNIGIMDPTLGSQVVIPVGAADFRALDLIGYDINFTVNLVTAPEPGTIALFGLGLLPLAMRLRRKA